jgi:hypothetical protein
MHEEYHFITRQPSQSINEIEFLNTTGSHTQEFRFELGLIVLIGPGGELFSDAHVEQTAALIRKMPLGPEDLIYLSLLHIPSHSEYARRAKQARIRALTSLEIEEQTRRMRASLTSTQQPGPRLARYDIREFVY